MIIDIAEWPVKKKYKFFVKFKEDIQTFQTETGAWDAGVLSVLPRTVIIRDLYRGGKRTIHLSDIKEVEILNRMYVENNRSHLKVTIHGAHCIFDLAATNKDEWDISYNPWVYKGKEPVFPDDVKAVLEQIYLGCRKMAPLRWIDTTVYMLNWTDPIFEPLFRWVDEVGE